MHVIYDKTDKGREEIAARRYGLAPRLRPLLVMVDGKKHADELLDKLAAIGLSAANLQELADAGYIQACHRSEPAPVEAPPEVAREPVAELGEKERFLAVYQFYNDTIKSAVGLRGFGLQLKVEKASTLDELRQLRNAYLEAVRKAKGDEAARSLRGRLDALLGPRQSQPDTVTQMA